MERAAVTNVAHVAKLLMTTTFIVLLWIHRGNASMFAIFLFIYLIGVLYRKKHCFWKVSFVTFSIMAFIFSFGVFGTLEPNSPPVIETGNWLSLDTLLFILPALSSIAAFMAGRQLHKAVE